MGEKKIFECFHKIPEWRKDALGEDVTLAGKGNKE